MKLLSYLQQIKAIIIFINKLIYIVIATYTILENYILYPLYLFLAEDNNFNLLTYFNFTFFNFVHFKVLNNEIIIQWY